MNPDEPIADLLAIDKLALAEMAAELAGVANMCCHRSDGWEENIRERIFRAIQNAYDLGRDIGR